MKPDVVLSKEQLCKEIVERMIKEAKAEANEMFQAWKKKFPLELILSYEDEMVVIKRILSLEFPKYNKELNILDIRHVKEQKVKMLSSSNNVLDNELNFIKDGFEAHKQIFIDQFFVLKKIEFLKNKLAILQEADEPAHNAKIKWYGKASQMGYLINLLMDTKYIEKDGRKLGQKSLRKIARIVYDAFSIPDLQKKGETTFENFYKELYANSVTSGHQDWVKMIAND
ncbi:hypothetical protein HXX01_02850 [Candidatus Nomurabacteria bacterium]|nr:hypothetical protein [Candidatus Nomurabacteria bacterium]